MRAGAATYAVGLPGKEAAGMDLRYQATIGQTARDCTLSGGMVTARIGIQGRVIVGPAGALAGCSGVVISFRVDCCRGNGPVLRRSLSRSACAKRLMSCVVEKTPACPATPPMRRVVGS